MKKDIVLIGAGGHAKSIADAISSIGLSVRAFVDEAKIGKKIFGLDVFSKITDIKNFESYDYIIAIGDNSLRRKVNERSLLEYPDIKFTTIIHKTAYIMKLIQMDYLYILSLLTRQC